jgi:two-component system, chemotaxis family, chemotaxis protein CheY
VFFLLFAQFPAELILVNREEALMSSEIDYDYYHGRSTVPVLVVCGNGTLTSQACQAAKSIGFINVSAAPNFTQAISRLRARKFAIIFYDVRLKDMPCEAFVKQVMALESGATLIALSKEPRVDDVFALLKWGTRGFVTYPFTADVLEDAIMRAAEGPPFSEAVLNAANRNAALANVVLNNLYRVSVLTRQARDFPSAARALVRQQFALHESMELARIFCEGDFGDLQQSIMSVCLERSEIAASRIGRTRVKLREKRNRSSSSKEKLQAVSA